MSEKRVALTRSQKQLFAGWENDLRELQGKVASLFNELVLFKLEKLAAELGIDLEKEQWTFDFQAKEFVKQDKVTPIIPSGKKKRGRPKKDEEEVVAVDAEVVDEEPAPPDEEESPN